MPNPPSDLLTQDVYAAGEACTGPTAARRSTMREDARQFVENSLLPDPKALRRVETRVARSSSPARSRPLAELVRALGRLASTYTPIKRIPVYYDTPQPRRLFLVASLMADLPTGHTRETLKESRKGDRERKSECRGAREREGRLSWLTDRTSL